MNLRLDEFSVGSIALTCHYLLLGIADDVKGGDYRFCVEAVAKK